MIRTLALCIFAFLPLQNEPVADPCLDMVFLGASIASGYGLQRGIDFPSQYAQFLGDLGICIRMNNMSAAGAATGNGVSQLKKYLKTSQSMDYLFIALGLSDIFYGVSKKQIKENLSAVIQEAKQHHPGVKIYLFQCEIFQRHVSSGLPPRESKAEREYEEAFGELCKEHGVELLPFVLKDIRGQWSFFQEDGLHPNTKGSKKIAEVLLEHTLGEIKSQE